MGKLKATSAYYSCFSSSIAWTFACQSFFTMIKFDYTCSFAPTSSCELTASFVAHVLASETSISTNVASFIINDGNSLITSKLPSTNYLNFLQVCILFKKSIKLSFIKI